MRTFDDILKGRSPALFNDLCYLDFSIWAEDVFGIPAKDFHLHWVDAVNKNRFVVVKAFRGSGKSKFLGVMYPIWLCWFKPGVHILLTASELNQAIKLLDEIRDLIEDNEFLKELMPPNPATWKKTELKMTNGSRIFVKPYTHHIKGVHVDYAFCDEIQDCADRDVYYKAIAPTVNNKKGKIVAVGTPNNPGDLLEELFGKPEFIRIYTPVLRAPGESMWPERFPIDEIEAIRNRDGESSFQTQYLLNPNAEVDNAVFSSEWISKCFDSNETFHERAIGEGTFILGADFAISRGARADFDAYVVVEKVGTKTFIRWGERHKGLSKDAKVQRIVDLYSRFKPRRMILDPSGIGEAIIQELRQRALPVEAGEFHSKSRNKMLINLVSMIQPNKDGISELVIPRNPEDELAMTFTRVLIQELISFREVKSDATQVKALLSKGPHDDTVMSLALACKGSSEQKEFMDIVGI